MHGKLTTGVTRGLLALGATFFAWTAIQAWRNTTAQWTGSPGATAGLLLLAAAVLLLLGFAVNRYLSRVQAVAVLVVLAAGVRLWWIAYVDTQPVSDFLDMYTAARQAARGDFSFGTSDYFTRWVYQLGFTLYEGFVLRLFGDHLLVLKLFNVIFNTGIVLLVYAIAAQVFGEWCGRAAGLSFALYVPQIMMCSVLTNQHISTFFFFLGAYLCVVEHDRPSAYRWALIGGCFALGNLMRPLGGVFVAGYLAFVVLYGLWARRADPGPVWRRLAAAAGVVAVYFALLQSASWALQATGVTPYPLSNPEPYWKFMVGVNPETTGGWSQADTDYVLQYPLGEARDEAERRLFLERLEDKPALARLLLRKLEVMWGAEDSAFMWSMWQQDRPRLQRLAIQGERIGYLLAAGFGFIAMATRLFARRRDPEDEPLFTLLLILLLGYAAIHIAIEIQTRYRMDMMPGLFILQSYGVYWLGATLTRGHKSTNSTP